MAMHNCMLRMMFHEGATVAALEAYIASTGLVPDKQSFGALLHACARERDIAKAADVFGRMQAKGAPPSSSVLEFFACLPAALMHPSDTVRCKRCGPH